METKWPIMMIKSAPAFHVLFSSSSVLSSCFLLILCHLFPSFPFSFLHIMSSHAMFSSLFSSITFSSSLVSCPFCLISCLYHITSCLILFFFSSFSSRFLFLSHLLSPCSLLFHITLSLYISCFFSSSLVSAHVLSSLISSCLYIFTVFSLLVICFHFCFCLTYSIK